MALKKILLIAAASVVLLGTLPSISDAQSPTFRRHRTLRWLGQGFSDGYHRCNPGYDSTYYNPYSAHNSSLVSKSPEFMSAGMARQNAMMGQANRFFVGVPASVYSAPPMMDHLMMPQQGQHIDSSFAPSQSNHQSADDNSFEIEESNVEDAADEKTSQDADIEAAEERSDESSAHTLGDEPALGAPSLFTPAAYRGN